MGANVTMSLDLPFDVEGTLHADEFEVLQEAGEEARTLAQSIWVGWKYGPHYPREQMGTSNAAWRYEALQPGEGGFTNGVQLLNDAEIQPRSGSYEVKAWGKPTGREKPYANNQAGQFYAAFVTRSGSSRPEWEVVFDRIITDILPDTERRLRDRIVANLGKKRRRGKFDTSGAGLPTEHFEIF